MHSAAKMNEREPLLESSTTVVAVTVAFLSRSATGGTPAVFDVGDPAVGDVYLVEEVFGGLEHLDEEPQDSNTQKENSNTENVVDNLHNFNPVRGERTLPNG
jgi:hypothetical protein